MGERYVVKTEHPTLRSTFSAFEGQPPDEIEYEKPDPYTETEQRTIDALKAAIAKVEAAEVHCGGCDGEDCGDSADGLREILRGIERFPKRITPLTESEQQAHKLFRDMLFPVLTPLAMGMPDATGPVEFRWVEDKLNAISE